MTSLVGYLIIKSASGNWSGQKARENWPGRRGGKVPRVDILAKKGCGDVAQLGERVNGIHEVVGSTPIVSTISF